MRKAVMVAGLLMLLCVVGTVGLRYGHGHAVSIATYNAAAPAATQMNSVQAVGQSVVHGPVPEQPAPAPVRGVIEGFYGQPWTFQQRVDMLRFMAGHHFNTYVYAPKDDPYQLSDWRQPYPASLLQQMSSLVYAAQASGIRFVYSISPGLLQPLPDTTPEPGASGRSITYSSSTDTEQLEEKVDQLRSIGVHTFLLSLDDVQRTLKSPDAYVYGSDFARAHIDLVNRVFRDESGKDPQFQLWLAPTVYDGVADNHYWLTIRSRLNPAVKVVWTGGWVLNARITTEQARQVTRLLGRKPILWDNYPVNDYTYATKHAPALFMGPLRGRSPDLLNQLSGYMANPMIQSEASKLPLATIGQYLATPQDYNADTAWLNAVRAVDGVGDTALYQTFCTYADSNVPNSSGNQAFATLAASFWSRWQSGGTPTADGNLREELQALAQLPIRLHQTMSNESLWAEINPWVTKLGDEGTAGLLAVTYLDTPASSPDRAGERQELATRLKSLQQSPLHIGNSIVQFIEQALAH